MAFIAQSSIIPYLYWTLLMYFIVEGRKSLLKPLLMRFYRRVTQHEVDNFFTYYHENVEVVVRKLVNSNYFFIKPKNSIQKIKILLKSCLFF